MDETKLLVNELNRKMKKPALHRGFARSKNMEIAEAEALFYQYLTVEKGVGRRTTEDLQGRPETLLSSLPG
jgi:hypothetical protein